MSDKKDNDVRVTLRIPPQLHAMVKASSADARRSLNAQILAMMETYFDEYELQKRINDIRRDAQDPQP